MWFKFNHSHIVPSLPSHKLKVMIKILALQLARSGISRFDFRQTVVCLRVSTNDER